MTIQSSKVWHNERFHPLRIEIEDGIITGIHSHDRSMVDEDYGDAMIIPGMVDIHAHGYMGSDCNHATCEWLSKWVNYYPTEGVTSIAATTSSVNEELLLRSMDTIATFMETPHAGANILGIYAEGPLLNTKFKGAQSIDAIVKPSVEVLKKYEKASKGKLVYCCIAPEIDDGLVAVKYAASRGIRVAIGHSEASLDICRDAKNAGVCSFTHVFNGMPGLHHRKPGPVGAAMYFDDMYAEIIGDGTHVDMAVVRIFGNIKGKDRLILVSDSAQSKGLSPGEHNLPGRHVFLDEHGVAKLSNGTIAGGSGKMNELLRNLVEKAALDEVTAINAATCNPLKMLGLADCKGYIAVGYDADIAVLAHDYTVVQTLVRGKKQIT